ncbi:MAG: NAD-dependent epimerase/dehydratase family protein [Bacteroidetes bacterium]|nr:NAD-dependent epimerase/dehydratase family protein [Bacteroidota bacterium]MBK9541354.1 NAD-dependent epimerase/dehydratase family protein [Bacteroidota bacterium]
MVLVTGGTGLVGSHLMLELSLKGKKIRALLRAGSNVIHAERVFKSYPELWKKIEWVEGDVTDVYSVLEALEGVEEVYHAAGLISFSPLDFKMMLKVNVEGTANMVNMSLEKGIKRFCHISSVAAIGRNEEGIEINEKSVWKTSSLNSNYAISKYGAEREVWRGVEEGLSAVIVNPTIILGPGNWDSGSSNMILKVWTGLRFYTTGMTGFVDVRDVASASIELMEKGIKSQRYVLNSENISYQSLFDMIALNLGRKKPNIRVSHLLGEIAWRGIALANLFSKSKPLITKETTRNGQRTWKYSSKKLINETGFKFIPLKDSIAYTCKVFLEERSS